MSKQTEAHRYRIVPIGSTNTGWAIERDGQITRTGPNLEMLGAWLDAILAGASIYDADDIAEVIARRPRPTYEERRAVFKPTGRPEPSREPFPIVSKGGGPPGFLTSCRPPGRPRPSGQRAQWPRETEADVSDKQRHI